MRPGVSDRASSGHEGAPAGSYGEYDVAHEGKISEMLSRTEESGG